MSLIKSSCLASAAVVLLSAMAILGVGAAKTFAQAPSGPGAHGQIDVVQRPDAAEMQGQLRNVQFGPGIFPTPRAEDARPAAL